MTEEELITYFNEHVLYELLMIRYAQRRLTPDQTPILWNALFATFNVSARNLYNFLTNGGKGRNSVNVKDYIKYCRSFQLPSISKITGTLQKLNPQVLHMSTDRTIAVNEKITRERVAAVGDWVEKSMTALVQSFEPTFGRRILFARADPFTQPSGYIAVTSAVSATNHVWVLSTST